MSESKKIEEEIIIKNKKEEQLVRLNYTFYQLKSLLSNLLLIFIPMGVFYLALILAVYFFSKNFLSSFTDFVSDSIKAIQSAANYTPEAFSIFFKEEINVFSDTIRTSPSSLSLNYFNEFLERFKSMLSNTYAPFADQIMQEGIILLKDTLSFFLIASLILLLGYFFSDFITKIALHKYGEKNSMWRSLLSVLVESLVSTLFLLLGFILAIYTPIGLYSFIFLYLIFYCILSLLIAYWLNGKKQIQLKQVFNVRNILQTLLCLILFMILPVLFWIAIYYLFGTIVAILATIPLLSYSLNCIRSSANNYTIAIREKTLYSKFIKPELEKRRKANKT